MMNLQNSKVRSIATFKPLCVSILVALTACGGGGGGNTSDVKVAEGIDLNTYLDADARLRPNFTAISTGDLPNTGRATYDGAIAGQLSGEALSADLGVIADFASDEVSGTASGFQIGDGTDLSGSLAGRALIDRNSNDAVPQFQLTLDGQLNGQTSTIALDGAYVAQSGQSQVIAVAGQAEGLVAGRVLESGAFAAE